MLACPPRRRPATHRPGPLIDFIGAEDEYVASAFGGQLLSVRLGPGGAGLSAGQQQQLCLARALLRGCAVVCLDEVTSCADGATAASLQAAVREHLAGATVIQVNTGGGWRGEVWQGGAWGPWWHGRGCS